jgi:hypothetical protein
MDPEGVGGATVLIWAPDVDAERALAAMIADLGYSVRALETDAELAAAHTSSALLVAEYGPRLQAQQAFVRGALILIDPRRGAPPALTRRAYAVVETPQEAELMVDRFFVHRRLAEQAGGRRGSPARCSRCGRGFDARKARDGAPSQRFVRFGAVALCGGCVEDLRKRLREAETAVVEADVRRR